MNRDKFSILTIVPFHLLIVLKVSRKCGVQSVFLLSDNVEFFLCCTLRERVNGHFREFIEFTIIEIIVTTSAFLQYV